MTIATVISITGRAWARDPDGNVRELNVGDTLQENEVLVTSDNGSAQLDFGDGLDPTLVEGGEQVAMLPELDSEIPVDVPGFAAMDDDLETLLAALEDDDVDLLDVLDATAAGAGPGGAADGGHSFVRLARIAEDTDPLAFDFGMTDLGGLPEEEGGAAILAAAEEEPIAPEEELVAPTAGSFDVSVFDVETLGETGSVASGVLPFTFGSGGAGTISFSAMDGVESQVGQENLVYSWDSETNTLTAFSAGRELTIFTIGVDPGTGEFTLTQVNNLLHEEGMDEALTSLVYTVTSGSGTATGSLNITIVDDVPTVESVHGSEALDELSLESSDADLEDPSFWYELAAGGLPVKEGGGASNDLPPGSDDGYGNDIPYWPESPNSLDLSAFFDATIDWGADGAGAQPQWHYGLSLTEQGEDAVDSGLSTGDEQIYLHVVNGMIVGSTSQTAPSVESGAEDIAFVLFIQGSQLSLVQFKAIDHPPGVNPGESIGLGSDLISLTGTVTVVDADGDIATNSGVIDLGVLLGFIDDGPLVELGGDTLAVEAGDSIEGTWNTDPGGDVVGASIFVSINGGEEQEVSFSDGEATFNVYLEDGETLAGTLSFQADGTWSFAAGTNLDHSDGKVPVSFELIKIDGDGDRESASHTIKIKDGAGP
ncbi:retention module-containing protein, partial [Billgrantia kenyensis]